MNGEGGLSHSIAHAYLVVVRRRPAPERPHVELMGGVVLADEIPWHLQEVMGDAVSLLQPSLVKQQYMYSIGMER
eukprot:SAG22_NODE_16934_length_314_cov_1.172093_1_plen_74_part_01